MKIAIPVLYDYNTPMANCYFCGTEIPTDKKIYRTTLCSSCGNPLKICYHCRFYDAQAPHGCKEHIVEPVQNKETANFCDYFVPAESTKSRKNRDEDHKSAVDTFNSLFSD